MSEQPVIEPMKFPWRYAWLNCALMYALALVWCFFLTRENPGLFGFLSVIIFTPVLIFACLGLQRILFFSFRRLVKNKIFWSHFLLLPSVVIAILAVYDAVPGRKDAEHILSMGEFPPLPRSAFNIKTAFGASYMNASTGEKYLRFEAPPEVIDDFVNSARLLKVQPRTCGKGKFPFLREFFPFPSPDKLPAWFPAEATSNGRFLETYWRSFDAWMSGFAFVDDVNHVVYVYVFYMVD